MYTHVLTNVVVAFSLSLSLSFIPWTIRIHSMKRATVAAIANEASTTVTHVRAREKGTQQIVCFVNAFIFVDEMYSACVCVLIAAAQETAVLFGCYSVTAQFALLIHWSDSLHESNPSFSKF